MIPCPACLTASDGIIRPRTIPPEGVGGSRGGAEIPLHVLAVLDAPGKLHVVIDWTRGEWLAFYHATDAAKDWVRIRRWGLALAQVGGGIVDDAPWVTP